MTRSRKNVRMTNETMSGIQFPLLSLGFYMMRDSEHFRVVHCDLTKQDLVHIN